MCIFDNFPNKELQQLIKQKEAENKVQANKATPKSKARMSETYRSEPGFCG